MAYEIVYVCLLLLVTVVLMLLAIPLANLLYKPVMRYLQRKDAMQIGRTVNVDRNVYKKENAPAGAATPESAKPNYTVQL